MSILSARTYVVGYYTCSIIILQCFLLCICCIFIVRMHMMEFWYREPWEELKLIWEILSLGYWGSVKYSQTNSRGKISCLSFHWVFDSRNVDSSVQYYVVCWIIHLSATSMFLLVKLKRSKCSWKGKHIETSWRGLRSFVLNFEPQDWSASYLSLKY